LALPQAQEQHPPFGKGRLAHRNPEVAFLIMTEKQIEALAILRSRPHLLWANVYPGPGCWLWAASVNQDGYGSVRLGSTGILAHRAAYLLSVGDIPEGQCVCHSCDTPGCCNPEHLFLGSHRRNMGDMKAKGRRKGIASGAANGRAKLTADAVERIRTSRAIGVSLKELAGAYGVGLSTISRVSRGENWK
jgi:hypothetical protein